MRSEPVAVTDTRAADLSPHAQLALVARLLYRQGYDEPMAGHISFRDDDNSLLVNPFELSWDRVTASDVVRTDADGTKVDGRWSVTPALALHLAVYRARPDVRAVVHNHPRWTTIWACCHRIPPIYDQTSALVVDEVAMYNTYSGDVVDPRESANAVAALGGAAVALLANHGVLVVGDDLSHVYHRASVIEIRSERAWHAETLGGAVPMPEAVAAAIAAGADGGHRWPGLFEGMARRECALDPSVLC
jgi:ribulose-5-phosphate 4-epimerase/fuculose-1-phosphate aldolase